ncbi:histidine kinase [Flavobacterium sp.]|uniref:tetratricopeptide repeat-containing sensor histidine kinase n=1 Tax=Flavobacterium sp. TaxID=239 RepID=UPI003A8C9C29
MNAFKFHHTGFLFTLLFCCNFCFAQNDIKTLDSLKTEFFNHAYDTNAVAFYNKVHKLGEKLIKDNTLKKEAQSILYTLEDYMIGVYLYKGEYDKAISLNTTKLNSSLKQQDSTSITNSYLLFGKIYAKKKEVDKGFNYYNKAAQLAIILKDYSTLVAIYENMAVLYGETDNDEKQIEYHFKVLKLKEKYNLSNLTASYLNIGLIFSDRKKYDKALSYYQKSLKELKKNKDDYTLTYNYMFLSDLYRKKKVYDSVIYYGNKALHLAKAGGYTSLEADAYNFIGIGNKKTGNYYNAIALHSKSYDLYKQIDNNVGIIQAANQLGDDYFTLDSVQKATGVVNKPTVIPSFIPASHYNSPLLDKGLLCLDLAKEKIKVYGIAADRKTNIKFYKKIYTAKGNYKKALQMQALEFTIADSIKEEQLKAKALKKEFQYAYEKKKELDSIKIAYIKTLANTKIEKEKSTKKTLYFIIAIVTLIMLLVYARLKYLQKNKELIIEGQKALVEKKQKEIVETELDYLKAQINPHFLFNSLNTIYFKINKENKEAREALIGFSEILRYQLYECNLDTVNIEKEIKYLNDYIQLQLLRKNDSNIKCNIDITDNVINFQIAPLLLVNYVENAFKHLRNDSNQTNSINIFLDKTEDTFIFEIENDKNIRENIKDNGANDNGIGLLNVKRRLELIYPNRHTIKIEDKTTTYKVTLTIKLNNYDQ